MRKHTENTIYEDIIIELDEILSERELEEAEKRIYEAALREKIQAMYSKEEEWN